MEQFAFAPLAILALAAAALASLGLMFFNRRDIC
jgi:putative exporter of polyketide antibiotics